LRVCITRCCSPPESVSPYYLRRSLKTGKRGDVIRVVDFPALLDQTKVTISSV